MLKLILIAIALLHATRAVASDKLTTVNNPSKDSFDVILSTFTYPGCSDAELVGGQPYPGSCTQQTLSTRYLGEHTQGRECILIIKRWMYESGATSSLECHQLGSDGEAWRTGLKSVSFTEEGRVASYSYDTLARGYKGGYDYELTINRFFYKDGSLLLETVEGGLFGYTGSYSNEVFCKYHFGTRTTYYASGKLRTSERSCLLVGDAQDAYYFETGELMVASEKDSRTGNILSSKSYTKGGRLLAIRDDNSTVCYDRNGASSARGLKGLACDGEGPSRAELEKGSNQVPLITRRYLSQGYGFSFSQP